MYLLLAKHVIPIKINTHLYCCIFSLCCINSAFAQANKKQMDSLYSIATTISDADSSTLIIERLLKQTRANHYQSGTLKLLLLKAINLYNSGKFDIALKETYNIEQEVRETKDFARISHLLALRANCYGNLFYFDKSKNCLKESTF